MTSQLDETFADMDGSSLLSAVAKLTPAGGHYSEGSALGIPKEMLYSLLENGASAKAESRRLDPTFMSLIPMAFMAIMIAISLEEEALWNDLDWGNQPIEFML